jgi:hypothetical protein
MNGSFRQEASMKWYVAVLLLVLPFCLVLAGCEPPKTTAGAAATAPPGPPKPPAPPGSEPAQQPAAEAAVPETERVKAAAGVGIKGRSLDEYEGVVVTPVKAYFSARERVFFEIEFPGNYSRWIILEDQPPKDFDELKARFLDPLGLTAHMPKLPEGHKYVWDPMTQELLVERPKLKSQPVAK